VKLLRLVVTWALLLFVGATVGKLVIDAVLDDPPVEDAAGEAAAEGVGNALIVWFIHTDLRCWNCNTIEKFAHETLTERFADELASGAVHWQVANMDEPGSEHYGEDFDLLTSSVVLVEMEGGERKDWKNLSRVWDLVTEEEEFKGYVEKAVRGFLEEGT
jgi:hypothetical protein